MMAYLIRGEGEEACRELEAEFAGCHAVSGGCDGSLHLVEEPTGERWAFTSGCFPVAWSNVSYSWPQDCPIE
ncbi:MAG TPA: hypothetical protein VLC09_12840 [Polyangiaceae bacterium]|nr:hypothetical protein [Polyangiaceae bacterium]